MPEVNKNRLRPVKIEVVREIGCEFSLKNHIEVAVKKETAVIGRISRTETLGIPHNNFIFTKLNWSKKEQD